MAEEAPIARSPIAPAVPEVVEAGWAVSGRQAAVPLTITDLTPLTKVLVRAPWEGGTADRLGVGCGRSARQEWGVDESVAVLVVGSGPGEWLVLAPPRTEEQVREHLGDLVAALDELVSVVDLTHGRALVRLTGARSRDLLAMECGVDLGDARCADGTALRSAVSGVSTDLVRDDLEITDREAALSYLLHCERSSGQYLFDSLLDAGAEFDLDVAGFTTPGI